MIHQRTHDQAPRSPEQPPTGRRPIIAVAAVIATLLATAWLLPAAPAGAGIAPASDYAAPGPYATASTAAGQHTIYYPTEGDDLPIILWGNGTGTTPAIYGALLDHFASHGFIVVAANTSNAGSGAEMLAGIDVLKGDAELAGRADFDHIGATGHSQGGGGATTAGFDPRVDTVFPIEPAPTFQTGKLNGPAIFFAGQNDTIVQPSWVRSEYEGASHVPAAYAELAGATHFTAVGDVGGFRAAATAWARWQLGGDGTAGALFAGPDPGLGGDAAWSVLETNAALQALDPGAPLAGGSGGGAGAGDVAAEPAATVAAPAVAVAAEPDYTG